MREINDYVPGIWGRETTCSLTPLSGGVLLEVEEHRALWAPNGTREYAQVCLSPKAMRDLHAALGALIAQREAA